ncbi:MAG: hypothetical protein ACNA8W_25260 [Bradymonadaceae bacterium]
MGLGKAIMSWFHGDHEPHPVIFDEDYDGVVVHLVFGDGPPCPRGPFELVLSEVRTPTAAMEVVRFCHQASLPIDAWVVSGFGSLGAGMWRTGRWLGAWARQEKRARIVILTDDLTGEDVRRLSVSLRSR